MSDKPNITRDGFIVEKVTEGCDCRPLSVMDKHYKGKDYWSDLTDGREKYTMSAYLDIEGVCPKCGADVVYNEYLVVTEVKEQTMTTVEELLELISVERDKAGKLVVKDVFGSVHGDVRGHVNGNVDGDVMGNIEGSVRGSIYGDVWGDVWWRVCGKVLNT